MLLLSAVIINTIQRIYKLYKIRFRYLHIYFRRIYITIQNFRYFNCGKGIKYFLISCCIQKVFQKHS